MDSVDLQLDVSNMTLTMVVPWSLPEELQDDASEPRAKMGKIFKDKVGEDAWFTSVITYCTSSDSAGFVVLQNDLKYLN